MNKIEMARVVEQVRANSNELPSPNHPLVKKRARMKKSMLEHQYSQALEILETKQDTSQGA